MPERIYPAQGRATIDWALRNGLLSTADGTKSGRPSRRHGIAPPVFIYARSDGPPCLKHLGLKSTNHSDRRGEFLSQTDMYLSTCAPDRSRQAAGGAREAGAARLLSRGDQCPSAAAIAMAAQSPGGLLMPNQSLLYTGRVPASSQLNPMMHVGRELCGGQICVTPDFAAFQDPETAPWLENYYTINEDWRSEDQRPARLRARPAQLRLRRSPADLPALRAIAAFCPPHRGLPEISTGTHRSASSTGPLAFRTGCSPASERCGRAQPARGIRVSG